MSVVCLHALYNTRPQALLDVRDVSVQNKTRTVFDKTTGLSSPEIRCVSHWSLQLIYYSSYMLKETEPPADSQNDHECLVECVHEH